MPDDQLYELCEQVVNEQIATYASAIQRVCTRACPINHATLIGPPGPPGLPGERGEQVSYSPLATVMFVFYMYSKSPEICCPSILEMFVAPELPSIL